MIFDVSVALTACANSETFLAGSVVKFTRIRSIVGINNISLLNSTGKFSCEEEGLYQISVSIVSKTVHSRYNIFKNNRLISWTYVSDDDYIDTGTTVAAVELKVNDTLWVMANTDIIDYLGWSCVTIIKIK
jgi:hypothetical protein